MVRIIKIFFIVFLFFFIILESANSSIPYDRIITWNPGINESLEYKVFINVRDYGAKGDGYTDDSQAIRIAIDSANYKGGGIVFFPEGNYLIKRKIYLKDNIVLKGRGPSLSKITIDLTSGDHGIHVKPNYKLLFNKISENINKKSKSIKFNSKLKKGDYIEIRQKNDPRLMFLNPVYNHENWNVSWAENARGEIKQVEEKIDSTVYFKDPFFHDYFTKHSAEISKVDLIKNCGIVDLCITRNDKNSGANIKIEYAKNCFVDNVESSYANRAHVFITNSINCEVKNSYFHHAHNYGDGGNGYGVELEAHATSCLVENNIFDTLRHSIIIHTGSSGNVVSYNFSVNNIDNKADISLHGHYPAFNLFEGNIINHIAVSDWWGAAGPYNTFFRNCITRKGILLQNKSNYQNFINNLFFPCYKENKLTMANYSDNTIDYTTIFLEGNSKCNSYVLNDNVSSLYLEKKPFYYDQDEWPSVGSGLDNGTQNPAQKRYDSKYPVFKYVDRITISGYINYNDIPLKALVLANGKNIFTDSNGYFKLENVYTDNFGFITIHSFCFGMNPITKRFKPTTDSNVQNFKHSLSDTGNTIDLTINSKTINNNLCRVTGQTKYNEKPITCLVLINGQYQFSKLQGFFDITSPIDSQGNVTILCFASGFKPYKLTLKP